MGKKKRKFVLKQRGLKQNMSSKPTDTTKTSVVSFLKNHKCGPIKQNPGNSVATFIFTRTDANLAEALLVCVLASPLFYVFHAMQCHVWSRTFAKFRSFSTFLPTKTCHLLHTIVWLCCLPPIGCFGVSCVCFLFFFF